jgi:hypothetical protein
MELNHFSDLTEAEFKLRLGYKPTIRNESRMESSEEEVESVQAPTSVDWRTSGAVTPVKD